MFNDLDFKAIESGGRGSSNDYVSVAHNKTPKKEEIIFRLSKQAMVDAGFNYRDKVGISFAANNTICRIQRSDSLVNTAQSFTLSQQISGNEQSAGIVRMTFKKGMPDLLSKANENSKENNYVNKARFIHKEGRLEAKKWVITFEMVLA